jgi:hypothetical protein
VQLASRLGAKVQGDDGEIYDEKMLSEQGATTSEQVAVIPDQTALTSFTAIPRYIYVRDLVGLVLVPLFTGFVLVAIGSR